MKEWMIANICCTAVGSIAIAVACHTTKSALPLLAFLLIPRWNYKNYDKDLEGKKDENE